MFFFLKEKQITQKVGKEAETGRGGEREKKGRTASRKRTGGGEEKEKATMALIVMVHPTRWRENGE